MTITHVLPKKYPTGTLTFEHTFPETGKFIGIVTVKSEHGQTYVSQFPFSVGKGFGNSIGIYASLVVVLAAGVFLIWHLGRKKKLVPDSRVRGCGRFTAGRFLRNAPRRLIWDFARAGGPGPLEA